jgi:pyruvate/2-oxoglutarate dehydrogenase complex dihydrolipoamide dehydrogenase (E3) component
MNYFDVVILGAGSAGEAIANSLAATGRSVAMIEKLRVGGECAYISCMPSKAMLRSALARNQAKKLVQLGGSSQQVELADDGAAFRTAVLRRELIVHNRSDLTAAARVISEGVALYRGNGIFTASDRITIGGDELSWHDLVISTGSRALIPKIEGLEKIDFWTSDMALSSQQAPESVLIVGGGPVGCELSQIFASFGVKTVLVEFSEQLAGREHPEIAAVLAHNLTEQGVDVQLNTSVVKVEVTHGSGVMVYLSNGREILVERLIIATGRKPNSDEIGLEHLGILPNESGAIDVDELCKVKGQEHIWAAGDITGIAPFTHTANYQGRIVSSNILGKKQIANYTAIPRAIYTDPPVASVGRLERTGETPGLISERFEMKDLPRNSTDGESGGLLILTADSVSGTLVGAAAIGPHADEWMVEATLAIRAQVPLAVLSDVVHAFPTFGEAFEEPIRKLAELIQK